MEPFTPGQIPKDKGELIKSLIQLKGFQRALGSRWEGCLEMQTSQEGPGDLHSHSGLFLLHHESKIAQSASKSKKLHQRKQVYSDLPLRISEVYVLKVLRSPAAKTKRKHKMPSVGKISLKIREGGLLLNPVLFHLGVLLASTSRNDISIRDKE